MNSTERAPANGRVRAAWAAAHAPVPGVVRWARTAAFVVPFTVLPSSLWRIGVCTFHLPIASGSVHLANASSGMFPRWIPLPHGRSVPVAAAVLPAAAGAMVLTLLWTWTAVSFGLGRRVDGSLATGPRVLEFDDWQG